MPNASSQFKVKLRGGAAKPPPWTFGGQTLACSGCWLRGSLAESAERQRGPGRLDILQGGCLKGTGAGCPHVPQDEPAGKTIGLAEQGALAGTQEKKEVLPPMEERAGDSVGVQGSR